MSTNVSNTADPGPGKVLETPDPVKTTEQLAAAAASIITFLSVAFGFDVSNDFKVAMLAGIGGIYTAFTLWHAGKVRAARAIGAGLAKGTATQASINP